MTLMNDLERLQLTATFLTIRSIAPSATAEFLVKL